MDQAAEYNFVTENPEFALGSSSEGVTPVTNFVAKNPEIALGSSSEGVTPVMNFVAENPETAAGSSSEGIIAVMDSNDTTVDIMRDMQTKRMKNKTGNAKSKIQNDKTKEMTVAAAPERKSLKRKATHPPTSEMVIESIKALKKRNGSSFEDIRKYMEEKYEVNMKLLKYHIVKFLQKGVGNGVLEKIDKVGAEERFKMKKSTKVDKEKVDKGDVEGRFKIKKSENIKKDSKNLPRKEGKVKQKKKMASTKKQIKK